MHRTDSRGPAVDQPHLQPGEARLFTLGAGGVLGGAEETEDSREGQDRRKIKLEGLKKSGNIHHPAYEYVNLTGQVGVDDSPPPGVHGDGGRGGATLPSSGNGDMFRPVCLRVPVRLLSQMGNLCIHL